MKPIILSAFAFAVLCNSASAQFKTSASTAESSFTLVRSISYADPVRPPGLRMRNTGRTLTIIGSILLVGGVAMAATADDVFYETTYTSSGSYSEGDPQGAVGVIFAVAGTGMVVPGIIFWNKGSKKYKAHLARQQASIGVGRTGLTLGYRF